MNPHPHDLLPQTSAVSALVRRITMRLSGELAFNGHPTLSQVETAGFFNLADASAMLDRIAVLPGMAQHETRARRDLLELYDIFNPLDPLEATQEMPRVRIDADASLFGNSMANAVNAVIELAKTLDEQLEDSFDAIQAERERDHDAQLDAAENDLGAGPLVTP